MAITRTTVTGPILDATGAAYQRAYLRFTPSATGGDDTADTVIVGGPVEIQPDEVTGDFSIQLAPSDTISYTVEIFAAETPLGGASVSVDYRIGLIKVPDVGPVALEDLLPIYDPGLPTNAELLAALSAAVAAAEAAASAASDSADEAAASAASVEPYADRAAAIAATVDPSVTTIEVYTPGGGKLTYIETTDPTAIVALTTNGGTRDWVPPIGEETPQHYAENTVPGTTDMITALEALTLHKAHLNLVGVTYPDFTGLQAGENNNAPTTFDFLGEVVAISRPWIIGALDTDLDGTFDTGTGAVHGITLDNGRLKAAPGFDDSPLATHTHPTEGLITTVPGCLIYAGTYENTDRNVDQSTRFYVNDLTFGSKFEIDCDFQTSGIFVENTHATVAEKNHIFNVKKNGFGLKTSPSDFVPTPNVIGNFNSRSGAPFPAQGIRTKNPELRIDQIMVSGYNRQSGASFPVGEDVDTMNTIGLGLYTADHHLVSPITTALTTSIEFDLFNNAQVYNSHPWSKKVVTGPDCHHINFSGTYFDFTDLVMYDSFDHILNGNMWLAGSPNLRLITSVANADADGLVLGASFFNGTSSISLETTGSGTWVAADAMKWMVSPSYYETPAGMPLMQVSEYLRVDVDGLHMKGPLRGDAVQQTPTDATEGRALLVDAFGMGNLLGAPLIADLDDITLPQGEYKTDATTVGTFPSEPGKFGVLKYMRFSDIVIRQVWYPNSNTNSNGFEYKRTYISGAWTPWIAGSEGDSNANGTFTKFENGTLICSHRVPLAYSVGDLMFGVWNFPSPFISAAEIVLTGNVDNDTALANLTPTRNELGQVFVDVASASIAHLGLRNQFGATSFGASDTVLIHMTATGRWY